MTVVRLPGLTQAPRKG